MRFVAALLFWLITTVLLAAAVPAMWAQRNVVSEDGYAALAAAAAKNPRLQEAMASELATQITALAAKNGYDLNNAELVSGVTAAYTANSGFPGQFAQANRIAHRWMFTDSVKQEEGAGDRWLIDIAPMLNDSSLKQTLGNLNLEVPQTVMVPITVPESSALRPGQLRPLATWGPWASGGVCVLTAFFALLTLATARSHGKALAALGVSGLLVGAAGWAGLEIGQRYINDALNRTTGDIRTVADVMVNQAEASLHHWLNVTLAVGVVLVVLGIIASMLGGLRRSD